MMKQRERSKDEIPFHEMTPAQKRSYLWDYWRLPVLAILVVAAFVISFIASVVGGKDGLLSVTIVDAGDDKSFFSYAEQFADENGISRDQLVTGDIVVGTSATGGGASSQAGMAFYVRLQGGSEDILIMPEEVFFEYASGGYFLDLTEVVSGEWKKKLISVDQRYDEIDEVQLEPIPCGIYVHDIPGMPDTPYYENAVIAISYNPDHLETAKAFLNDVLQK